ncbi:MAG: hypothetical protein WCR54_05205 [Clostridia bacterium]
MMENNYEYKYEQMFLGKVITLTNGVIEFSVSLDVGPRIISLKTKNGQNIMFNDVDDLVSKDCSKVFGEGKKWHIYGGHRLWLSPEEESTYYPDNDEIDYKLTENGILLMPKKWDKIDILPQILIEFIGENKLKINHKVKNLGQKRNFCLWALTVMKAGGKLEFDLSDKDTGYLANRNIVLWPYDDIKDKRLELKDNKIVLKSDVSVSNPYKIGAYNSKFKAEYNINISGKDVKFIKSIDAQDTKKYPDYCCNFEAYCSNYIHEVESLSQIEKIENGAYLEHTEFWEIY